MSEQNAKHLSNEPENYGKMPNEEPDCKHCLDSVPAPYVTARVGTYYVRNNLHYPIPEVTVKHTTSAYGVESTDFRNIPVGGSTSGTSFKYQTGAGSSFDYWYVEGYSEYGPGITSFKTKDNFYCSVSSSDNGNVYLDINAASNGFPGNLSVSFSNSSGCTTGFVY